MKRRGFLRLLLAFLGSTALASFLYPLLRFFAPPSGKATIKQVSLKKAELPVGKAKNIVFNNTPVIVINRHDKGYVVISRVCTHLGCLVDYDETKKRLQCPCHAGTFDLEGNVISGPPPKPLQKFSLKVEGENIVIG